MPDHVWARTHLGTLKRVPKATAVAEGWEFEDIAEDGEIPGAGVGAVTPFLHADELRKLETQTGEKFRDYDDYKRWCQKTGSRSLEKGEDGDRFRRELKEWMRSGQDGPAPERKIDWAKATGRKPVDIHELYRRMRNR